MVIESMHICREGMYVWQVYALKCEELFTHLCICISYHQYVDVTCDFLYGILITRVQ